MFNIVLVQPQIPPNTGNVIRLAANTGCALHLVEPLGFEMSDKLLRRAGLDYHEYAEVRRYRDWADWQARAQPAPGRTWAFSTRGQARLPQARFAPGDWLVFGSETAGLTADVLQSLPPQQALRLPMRAGQRSLNLSNAVAVAVFEAWRQCGWGGAA